MTYLMMISQWSEGLPMLTQVTSGDLVATKPQRYLIEITEHMSTQRVLYVGLTELYISGRANRIIR